MKFRSQLGAGGMAEVYLARDVEIGRDVAVKVLPSTFSSDKDRLQRFQQEACAAGALNHPNILSTPYSRYFVLEPCWARDAQLRQLCETVDNALSDSITQIFRVWIGTGVDERQNSERID
jgi:serine/threonine protein kinase